MIMITQTIAALAMITVWLVLYLMVIGARPARAEIAPARWPSTPYYPVLNKRPTYEEMKRALCDWDNEGGALANLRPARPQ
jgi:hypothetical protein